MSSPINTSSEPICAAVLLDNVDTVEALQQQLNVPLHSHHVEDDDDHDAHATQSSSASKITCMQRRKSTRSTARTVKILNLLTGLYTGVMFSCAGFCVLLQHWHTMRPKDVMLFSVVWGSLTSVSAYLLFSVLYIGTCCYFGNSSNRSNSKCLESPQTISILENCFAAGIFLGFCGVCTWTDVAYGTSPSVILLAVVMATFWACVMIYCAFARLTSRNNKTEVEQEQPAKPRRRQGTVKRKKSAAKPAEKSKPKALLPKYSEGGTS